MSSLFDFSLCVATGAIVVVLLPETIPVFIKIGTLSCASSQPCLQYEIEKTRDALKKKYNLRSEEGIVCSQRMTIGLLCPCCVIAQHEMELYRRKSAWFAGEPRGSLPKSIERME